ncbi:MAG: mechanosensitive ion channel family protein [Marmoricola sp.]
MFPLQVIDIPRACAESQSWSCATVYELTGNPQLSKAAEWWIGRPLTIAGIVIGAIITRWVLVKLINRVVLRTADQGKATSGDLRHDRRAARVKSLRWDDIVSSWSSACAGDDLGRAGRNVAPILASAGVVGVAIGLRAQSLVKALPVGIAMMLEDQYGVGDVVSLGAISARSSTWGRG